MPRASKSNWLATTALAAGVTLAWGAQALAAEAADAAASPGSGGQVEEVVVTGFRGSLLSARELKRRAVGSEDVIVAEDIAAFPDLNLAESLQRIPGVTISRDSGEGRQITLRGLGPDFTRTQLNGMEVLGNTASGMDNRGGVSRTRSFDYSLFASELFDRVTVQKSFAAEQDEGGIGGTVQLSTAKPFDYPGFKAVVSAKAQTNSNADAHVTPRLVGLISNRWGDFGALASVQRVRLPQLQLGPDPHQSGQYRSRRQRCRRGAAHRHRLDASVRAPGRHLFHLVRPPRAARRHRVAAVRARHAPEARL